MTSGTYVMIFLEKRYSNTLSTYRDVERPLDSAKLDGFNKIIFMATQKHACKKSTALGPTKRADKSSNFPSVLPKERL